MSFLNTHDCQGLLSLLSYLPISVLDYLEEEVNKFHTRASRSYNAALLNKCDVQQFISPYIDSEVNRKHFHFIKIQFSSQYMELIDLHYFLFKRNKGFPLLL